MARIRPRRRRVNLPACRAHAARARARRAASRAFAGCLGGAAFKVRDRSHRGTPFTCRNLAMRIRRATCPVLFCLCLTGCATSFELKNPMAKPPHQEARLAAGEAVGEYPEDPNPRDIAITAVIDRDGKSLDVINPTDVAYHGVRVWLNQQYVAWLNELPPRRVVHIAQDAFVDSGKGQLSLTTENI